MCSYGKQGLFLSFALVMCFSVGYGEDRCLFSLKTVWASWVEQNEARAYHLERINITVWAVWGCFFPQHLTFDCKVWRKFYFNSSMWRCTAFSKWLLRMFQWNWNAQIVHTHTRTHTQRANTLIEHLLDGVKANDVAVIEPLLKC